MVIKELHYPQDGEMLGELVEQGEPIAIKSLYLDYYRTEVRFYIGKKRDRLAEMQLELQNREPDLREMLQEMQKWLEPRLREFIKNLLAERS